MKKIMQLLSLVFLSGIAFAQQDINIVNSSSNYSNNIEYNTGEIFVVYTFGTNQVTSKEIVLNEDQIKEKIQKPQIKIYPNPTVNIVYYSLTEDMKFENLELFDQYQKLIFSSNKDDKQVSLENLPTGIYYLLFNKNIEYNYKIIKR
ncbi:T9SS type A sorting domain-containing protein [Flavobacterium sp.]|uniref:T9SS type A sorting domain-containing protein n=1 Tax=Flavobacterium sp. TaxID=239 RepID=UPI0025C3EB77|nr:T9SS type A sorting domain-containing protein [Flavobacterium sp.]